MVFLCHFYIFLEWIDAISALAAKVPVSKAHLLL